MPVQIRRNVRNAAVALWLVSLAAPARAQSILQGAPGASRGDITIGLTLGGKGTVLDLGGALGFAAQRTEHVALVGEVAAIVSNNYAPCPSAGGSIPASCSTDQVAHLRAALYGMRVRTPVVHLPLQGPLRLFAQVLGGAEWSSVTSVSPALQPGVGVDFFSMLNGPTLRLEADYSWVPGGPRNQSTGRVLLGMVMPIR